MWGKMKVWGQNSPTGAQRQSLDGFWGETPRSQRKKKKINLKNCEVTGLH